MCCLRSKLELFFDNIILVAQFFDCTVGYIYHFKYESNDFNSIGKCWLLTIIIVHVHSNIKINQLNTKYWLVENITGCFRTLEQNGRFGLVILRVFQYSSQHSSRLL